MLVQFAQILVRDHDVQLNDMWSSRTCSIVYPPPDCKLEYSHNLEMYKCEPTRVFCLSLDTAGQFQVVTRRFLFVICLPVQDWNGERGLRVSVV